MGEIENIVDQMKKAYEGSAWHGPALRELLADVSASQAAARPLKGAHTIWEIVLHIAAWQGVARSRLKGERLKEPAEGDWPEVPDSGPEAWQKALAKLDRSQQALVQQASELSEPALWDTAVGTSYSVYVMLHGVIQHTLYHAGQIALLKKTRA